MTAAAGRGAEPRAGHGPLLFAVLLLCAAPHLARLLLPTTSTTDPFYGDAALMFARGYEPYLDFTQVAFPFAEQTLALALNTFGVSLRVVEVCNGAVILLVALVLFVAGRRLGGPVAGAAAALLWSWSLWVIHFNLFERETWAALGTSLALCIYLGERPLAGRRLVLLALALLAAFSVKITAALPALGLCAHLLLTGRARTALHLLLLWLAGIALLTLGCWWRWGTPFLEQVYLFGFFRNAPAHTVGGSLLQLLGLTDPAQAAGFAALLVLGLPRLAGREGAPALVLLADLFYALVISPVLWGHNLINFAPSCALLAGALLAELVRRPELAGRSAAAAALVAAAVAVLPSRWLPGEHGPLGPYFGGRTRASVQQQADFLQRYSRRDDLVSTTEPWCAFAADRMEFVRFYDLQPVAQGVHASLVADGLPATFRKRQGPLVLGPGRPPPDPRVQALAEWPYAQRLIANAMVYLRPLFLQALALREIALVMEPLPYGVLDDGDLSRAGYRRFTDAATGISGWRPAQGRPYPLVRPLFRP